MDDDGRRIYLPSGWHAYPLRQPVTPSTGPRTPNLQLVLTRSRKLMLAEARPRAKPRIRVDLIMEENLVEERCKKKVQQRSERTQK